MPKNGQLFTNKGELFAEAKESLSRFESIAGFRSACFSHGRFLI
jgi:hypothetical protein